MTNSTSPYDSISHIPVQDVPVIPSGLDHVTPTEKCNAIWQKNLPPKLDDPGIFTIPCIIENCICTYSLCDTGAEINMMPLSVSRRLGIGEISATDLTIAMANNLMQRPEGMARELLVKVGELLFSSDFVVLDIKEDEEVPILLGRLFLATSSVLVDFKKGDVTLRAENHEVIFNVFEDTYYSNTSDSCSSSETNSTPWDKAPDKKGNVEDKMVEYE